MWNNVWQYVGNFHQVTELCVTITIPLWISECLYGLLGILPEFSIQLTMSLWSEESSALMRLNTGNSVPGSRVVSSSFSQSCRSGRGDIRI